MKHLAPENIRLLPIASRLGHIQVSQPPNRSRAEKGILCTYPRDSLDQIPCRDVGYPGHREIAETDRFCLRGGRRATIVRLGRWGDGIRALATLSSLNTLLEGLHPLLISPSQHHVGVATKKVVLIPEQKAVPVTLEKLRETHFLCSLLHYVRALS